MRFDSAYNNLLNFKYNAIIFNQNIPISTIDEVTICSWIYEYVDRYSSNINHYWLISSITIFLIWIFNSETFIITYNGRCCLFCIVDKVYSLHFCRVEPCVTFWVLLIKTFVSTCSESPRKMSFSTAFMTLCINCCTDFDFLWVMITSTALAVRCFLCFPMQSLPEFFDSIHLEMGSIRLFLLLHN